MWQCALGHICHRTHWFYVVLLTERFSFVFSTLRNDIIFVSASCCYVPDGPGSPVLIISNLFVAPVHFITSRKVKSRCWVLQLRN